MVENRPVLNRSMLERYDIDVHRPAELRAVLFGADEIMLGGVARCLDRAGVGALCVTGKAGDLAAQDCMFTVLIRGGASEKTEERVVQSLLCAVDPEKDFEELMLYAERDGIDSIFCHANAGTVEFALAARFICQLRLKGKMLPKVLLVSDLPEKYCVDRVRNIFRIVSAEWHVENIWDSLEILPVLCDGLFGMLAAPETEQRQMMMNYTDHFLMWAQPDISLKGEISAVPGIDTVRNYENERSITAETECVLEFLCAAGGYLAGKNTFADVLGDEKLRKWIAHTWFDELMPVSSTDAELRERTIRTFERFEDPRNNVPLLSVYGLLKRFSETVLPGIRHFADIHFEVPRLTVLAFSATVMLYAGVVKNDKGYEVSRGEHTDRLNDEPELLDAFTLLAHDMPAESLTYAVLADRELWNCDLRDIDGLEMAVVNDLSSIQRIGFAATLENRLREL